MADVQIKGVYTAVEVRDRTSKLPGCVYVLTFACDHGASVKVFVLVNPEAPYPLRMLAALLASTGTPEPREGWDAALCARTYVNEWNEPVGGYFHSDTGIRAIQAHVLGKRTTVFQQDTEHGVRYTPGPAFGFDNVIPFPSRA